MTTILICEDPSELAEVYRLRYKVFVTEMARSEPEADHKRKILNDSLDENGVVLAAVRDGRVVGSLRLNWLARGIGDYGQLYGLQTVPVADHAKHCIVTKLAIRSDARRSVVLCRLFRAVYALALLRQASHCWIDCNPHLEGVFQKFGFRTVRTIEHAAYGQVSLNRLDLTDRKHLTELRSPFLRVLDDPLTFQPTKRIC